MYDSLYEIAYIYAFNYLAMGAAMWWGCCAAAGQKCNGWLSE